MISIKLLCNFIVITLRHGYSPVNLLHISRTPFPKNTSGGLLLHLLIVPLESTFYSYYAFLSWVWNSSHFLLPTLLKLFIPHFSWNLGRTCTWRIRTLHANIYLLKVNNRNSRKRREICSKLTIKTPERRHDVVLVFLLLTLNIFHTFFYCSYCWL